MKLCKKTKKKLNSILSEFPSGDESLAIPILQAVQNKFGYIPKETITQISNYTKAPPARLYGVITFYAQFHTKPRGKNTIKCCRGTACHVKGSNNIIDNLKSKLQVAEGETTSDKKFTLETVACLGTCFLAPALMINNDYYGNVTKAQAVQILKNYK